MKTKHKSLKALLALFAVIIGTVCFAQSYLSSAISPIPAKVHYSKSKVELGKKLYEDKALSMGDQLSCQVCHAPKNAGTLNVVSFKTADERSNLNIPTILNTQHNFRFFWDGRADNLKNAIEMVLLNPKEMSDSWETILDKLNKNANYIKLFKDVYNSNINREALLDAMEIYIKTLDTPNAKFDKYLNGDAKALNDDELKGYALFESYGCVACHQGVNVGGNMMQKFGIYNDYAKHKKNIQPFDYGLYNITKREEDKFVFKVPSLRNVALTAPYLHDGSAKDLEAAIKAMAFYQIGRPIPDNEISLIIKFLHTLTGENVE